MNSSRTDESQSSFNNDSLADKADVSASNVANSAKKKSKKKKRLKSPSSNGSPTHKKPKKDPNKPEYPKVGYVRFMYVRREELKVEHPEMHHLDVTKKIGEEWMALPDDKKQPFLDAALEDKRRYKLEMKEYNKKLQNVDKKSAKKSKKASYSSADDTTATEDSPKKPKKRPASTPNPLLDNVDGKTRSKSSHGVQQVQQVITPINDRQAPTSSALLINTPPPTPTTPPQLDSLPMPGDIPIFTDNFLEHNRQMESELKKLRKLNTDYEQQNSVLEKHVENVRNGIDKTNNEIKELKHENEKLTLYLSRLRQKLATNLRNLALPNEPNGATTQNIDKYMRDLYDMAKSNSHGPASLNKAKDILRKLDLNIDLKSAK